MATWREIVNYISSNYTITSQDGTLLTLLFETEPGRSQLIFVSGLESDDPNASFVRFSSPFAQTSDISPQQFANCAETTFLGLSKNGDYYVVLHLAPMANLDASEIEWPLTFVTGAADELERQLGLGDRF